MDLSEEQANALFSDDRADGNGIGDFHLGIDFGDEGHVVIYTADERHVLSKRELDEMLEELEMESVYHAVTNKLKVLDHLRSHER